MGFLSANWHLKEEGFVVNIPTLVKLTDINVKHITTKSNTLYFLLQFYVFDNKKIFLER